MDFSKNEIILFVVIGVVVLYFALKSKPTTANANQIYGLTAKQALAPSDVLAFQNASEQSATRQDAFNLAKLNIASNLVGKSYDYQNTQKLLDKVQAFDLAQIQAQNAQQTKQSILNQVGNLLGKLLGGGSSGGSSSGGGTAKPTTNGGYTPSYTGSVNLPNPYIYDAGLINTLPDIWGWYDNTNNISGWFGGDNPPPDGSGYATGILDDNGTLIPFDNGYGSVPSFDLWGQDWNFGGGGGGVSDWYSNPFESGGGSAGGDWNIWYNDSFGA